ncbi:ABC-type transport auxiliary lipoprotein family protein [Vibrio sp. PP-XX7]
MGMSVIKSSVIKALLAGFITSMAIVISGCSSDTSSPAKLYLLPVSQAKPIVLQTAPVLMVKTDLDDYLNQAGLVYRTSTTEVTQAKNNLWAQRISEQVTQRIIHDLRSKQGHYWPVELNAISERGQPSQLYIRMQEFNGVYTGNAEISGEWTLRDGAGQMIEHQYFNINVPLKDAGYPALVTALSTGLDQLTDKLAKQLK